MRLEASPFIIARAEEKGRKEERGKPSSGAEVCSSEYEFISRHKRRIIYHTLKAPEKDGHSCCPERSIKGRAATTALHENHEIKRVRRGA